MTALGLISGAVWARGTKTILLALQHGFQCLHRIFLHGGDYVAVKVHGDSYLAVAQHLGYYLGVYALAYQYGRHRVWQVMKADLRKSSLPE